MALLSFTTNALALGAPGAQEMVVICLILVLNLGGLFAMIWGIIHAVKNPTLTENERLIAILLCVLLGLIGALIYYFALRNGSKGKAE